MPLIHIQESDYILSSDDEGPRNLVLEQERPLLHPEVLNHARPARPAQPQPHPALPPHNELNNADDDRVDMVVYAVITLCLRV